jgi:hypothetical protein
MVRKSLTFGREKPPEKRTVQFEFPGEGIYRLRIFHDGEALPPATLGIDWVDVIDTGTDRAAGVRSLAKELLIRQ